MNQCVHDSLLAQSFLLRLTHFPPLLFNQGVLVNEHDWIHFSFLFFLLTLEPNLRGKTHQIILCSKTNFLAESVNFMSVNSSNKKERERENEVGKEHASKLTFTSELKRERERHREEGRKRKERGERGERVKQK